MKITILKLGVFVLLFALAGAGCKKDDEYENIPLENLKCPCEHDVSSIKKIAVENVLLFDETKTSWDEMRTQTFDGVKSEFILYSKESKSMIFYLSVLNVNNICNVPEQIEDWTIPLTGVVVSFNADICIIHQVGTTNYTYSDCMLTSFKRKLK